MRIEDLWRELEQESRSSPGSWLTRYALPEPTLPLLVGVEPPSACRVLLLPLQLARMPPSGEWPECHGLEVFKVELTQQWHLGVRLTDPAFADIFVALAEDVAPRVGAAADAPSAAKVLISRLRRWQKFLSSGSNGLGPEQRRGLFGELLTLRDLAQRSGVHEAVVAWRAPEATHQDFQFSAGALEVKTTAAKQPQSVRITSERQLDSTGMESLFLQVVIVDEREVENPASGGNTLPDLIGVLRQACLQHPDAADLFEDRLLEAGYHDSHAARYSTTQYALRRIQAYKVSDNFPRIVEGSLASGVGDVSYALSLAACEPFSVSAEELVTVLRLTSVQ